MNDINSTLLQLFLLLNVFAIGALSVIAFQHARAHFKPVTPPEVKKTHPTSTAVHLPPEVKERLLELSKANFQSVLDRSAAELQHDLKSTATHIDQQLEKIGSKIVSDEMARYQSSLDQLTRQAETAITGAQADVETHQADLMAKLNQRQAELEAKLATEMTAEKQRLITQIDTKLSDAVASFLLETLQHNVDLGTQSNYLVAMLDEHKAELSKGISE